MTKDQVHEDASKIKDPIDRTIFYLKAINDLFAEASSEEDAPVEEFICPECKEWTSSDDPCCGVGPASMDQDGEDR